MDRNCLSIGFGFFPSSRWQCEITCFDLNHDRSLLATGSRQGFVALWKLRDRYCDNVRGVVSMQRLKESYDHTSDISVEPYFLFVASNNPIASPVAQVAFASGSRPIHSLKGDRSRLNVAYCAVEDAEGSLVSLHKDNSIAIWSLTDCRCLHKVKGPPFPIQRLCVFPDDRFIALVGRNKINVIDLWRLKLIATFDLDGTCKIDSTIYSDRRRGSYREPPTTDFTIDCAETSTVNVSPSIFSTTTASVKKPCRILRAHCGLSPFTDNSESDTTVDFHSHSVRAEDNSESDHIPCPLILAALLDNNEVVIWDLTIPITHYKAKYGGTHGTVTVVTAWDRHLKLHSEVPQHPADISQHGFFHRTLSPTDGISGKETFPMLRDRIPDLQESFGDICIVDRYLFVMLGIYIFVWYYHHDGALDRVAEILNMDVDDSLSDTPWHGFSCVRVSCSTILLFAWTKSGSVSIFLFPSVRDAKKQFRVLSTAQLPGFGDILHSDETIHVYIRKSLDPGYRLDFDSEGLQSIGFYMFRQTFDGLLSIGIPSRSAWSNVPTSTLINSCFPLPKSGTLVSSMFYSNGYLQRLDVLSSGYIRCIDASSGDIRRSISFQLVDLCLRRIFTGYRMKTLVLPGNKVQEWLSDSVSGGMPTCPRLPYALLHCLGSSYVVIWVPPCELLVYTLSTFTLTVVFRNLSVAPIRAIYAVFSINCRSSNVSDTVMYEIDDTFATIDHKGHLVIVQLSLLLDDLSVESSPPDIHERDIYSDTEGSSGSSGRLPTASQVEHFVSKSSCLRGIHRMQFYIGLLSCEIERVALNLDKDLVYVLTYHSILLWRLRSGTFLRELPYLETYRRAVISGESPTPTDSSAYGISTIAGTLSSLLTTDWQSTVSSVTSECTYQRYLDHCTPHDLLSPCMFQDKYFKKQLTSCLHMSFLRMHFSPYSDSPIGLDMPHRDASSILQPGYSLNKPSRRRLRYKSLQWRCVNTDAMALRIIRRARVILYHSRLDGVLSDISHCKGPATISYSIPVLIFPLQEIASNLRSSSATLLSKLADDATFIYLGIPSGTFSFPLDRSSVAGRTSRYINDSPIDHGHYFVDNYLTKEIAHPWIRRSFTFPCLFDDSRIHSEYRLSLRSNSNGYLSTCMLLRHFVTRVHLRSSVSSSWLRLIDVWLLMRLLVSCTSKESYAELSNELILALRYLSPEELRLHVCRAFVVLRTSASSNGNCDSGPLTICVCRCQGSTFTFGKRCGVCLQSCVTVVRAGTSPVDRPASWEESASMLLLVVVTMDQRLSAVCDFVFVENHLLPFAAYILRLMLPHMLSSEDTVRSVDNANDRRVFNMRSYCVEMFDRGFVSVWTFQLFDRSMTLCSTYSKSRVHAIARAFYKSDVERTPSTQFVIGALSQYRANSSAHWLSILRKCFLLDTCLMIRIVRWIVRERHLDKWYIQTSVKLITEFVIEVREDAIRHLPDVVVIVVRCLDPSDSGVRLLMLKPATSALFHLVKNFPMVAFYQNSQRFAVGSITGQVVIYDLRTATKCLTLGGDMGSVASLAFSSTGDYIAAYYMEPPCLVIWNCSSSGLLGSLLHSSKKERKIIRLKPVEPSPSTTGMVCYLCVEYMFHLCYVVLIMFSGC
uniref:WD domain, G-beta repeat containing protein n=1 Tax=Babesia bovis TaxID=5865 RepID=A7ATE3_BABBO|eukprot:XP_001609772.1 hypothetical protein [Babesia bovis T2Bo]